MKKTLFYTLATIFIATMFASCLGSSNIKEHEVNVFSYIREAEEDGMIIANTSTGKFVTSKEIREGLRPGMICYLTYDVSYNSMAKANVFEVYNVQIDKDVKTGKFLYETEVTQEMKDEALGLDELSIGNAFAGDWLGDYWGIGYTVLKGSNERIEVSVFYDHKNQIDAPVPGSEVGEAIPQNENKIVLDVYLKKIKIDEEEVKNPIRRPDKVHVSLASLRQSYEYQINNSESMLKDAYDNPVLSVKFRYWHREEVKNGPDKLTQRYIGNWGIKGGEFPKYAMVFPKEE